MVRASRSLAADFGESNSLMSCPWGRFPRATLDTCEPDVCGAIVHPAETASALAYVIVALIVWRRYREADCRIPARHLPGIVAIIGQTSGLFHASVTALFHALDLGVIFLLIGYLLTAQLVHRGQVAESNFPTVVVLFSIGGGLLPFLHLWLGFVGLVLGGVLVLWRANGITLKGTRADYRTAVGLFLPGLVLLLSDHGQIGCFRGRLEHFVQPHAIWHLLSATSFYFFYRYQRAIEQGAHPANPP